MKIAKMPMAEVVQGPWRRLEERKRLAMFNALVREWEGREGELIEQIVIVMGIDIRMLGEACLDVAEQLGLHSHDWQRRA